MVVQILSPPTQIPFVSTETFVCITAIVSKTSLRHGRIFLFKTQKRHIQKLVRKVDIESAMSVLNAVLKNLIHKKKQKKHGNKIAFNYYILGNKLMICFYVQK